MIRNLQAALEKKACLRFIFNLKIRERIYHLPKFIKNMPNKNLKPKTDNKILIVNTAKTKKKRRAETKSIKLTKTICTISAILSTAWRVVILSQFKF